MISDKFSTLRAEDRQRILHEGSGRDIMSASVEIVFTNEDHRFPVSLEFNWEWVILGLMWDWFEFVLEQMNHRH